MELTCLVVCNYRLIQFLFIKGSTYYMVVDIDVQSHCPHATTDELLCQKKQFGAYMPLH